MFKITIAVFFVVLILYSVSAGKKKDDKPTEFKDQPGCYIADLGRVLNYGDEAEDTKVCRKFRCLKKTDDCNLDQWYFIEECPVYNCDTVPGDSKALFPDCCDQPNESPCSGISF